MTKERFLQLELFSQPGFNNQKNTTRAADLRGILHRYEKAIIFFIIFIISCSVSFSFGVEKGKKARLASPAVMPDKIIVLPDKDSYPVLPAAATAGLPAKPKADTRKYTIQLATYQTRTYAQKEADRLKKKGFSPMLMPKGVHIILCVGNFPDKNTAKSLISKLEKKYKGCFVRTL